MNDRYTGIVLKQMDYRDNDLIISVLFKDLGKYSLIARGVKKPNSKNSFAISPYINSEFIFDFKENKNIFNIKNASLVKIRKNISKDILKMAYSALLCQIVDIVSIEDEDAFELLDFSLDRINDDNHDILICCLFVAQYLKKLGLAPYVDGCVVDDNASIKGISISEGGFICTNHNIELYDIDIEGLKKFRIINKANLDNYEILKGIDTYNYKDLYLLMDFLEFHTQINFKSYNFLKTFIVK